MDEAVGVVAIIVGIVLVVVGFGNIIAPENIYPSYVEKAIETCSKNGGMKRIELDEFYSDVYCKDGATFPNAIPMVGADENHN